MSDPDDILQSLVDRPRETISIELKSWIDPKSPEGEQKIARAALALRNQNGGYLVIGFNDKTGSPDPVSAGVNVRLQYHTDEIQRIVSRYASHPFVIEAHFPETGGVEYPVIRIPAGFKTPVVCKADLLGKGPDGKERFLLRAKDIYVRTVDTNHTVSSAPGNGRDIEELVERCFQNREADHTALLSKTFQAIPSVNLPAIFKAIGAVSETGLEALEGFETIFDNGEERYSSAMARNPVYHHREGFLNIALVIQGLTKTWEPSFDFLETLRIANPELTGWPIWLVGESLPNPDEHPYFWHDTYEQYIYRQADTIRRGHLDFAIFNPKGRFFLRRAFEDDMGPEGERQNAKTIEIYIQAFRIGEALAVGRAFANALGASVETTLSFAFRWSGIKNREIDLWAHPGAEFISARASRQDTSQSEVNIAASANDEELVARTVDVLQKLVLPFGDVKIPRQSLSEKLRMDLFKHQVG
jgi:Putative DNA-binding domain